MLCHYKPEAADGVSGHPIFFMYLLNLLQRKYCFNLDFDLKSSCTCSYSQQIICLCTHTRPHDFVFVLFIIIRNTKCITFRKVRCFLYFPLHWSWLILVNHLCVRNRPSSSRGFQSYISLSHLIPRNLNTAPYYLKTLEACSCLSWSCLDACMHNQSFVTNMHVINGATDGFVSCYLSLVCS